MIASILIQPLSELGLIGVITTLGGFAVMIIRELKRKAGDPAPTPPKDNSDVLGIISEIKGQVAAATTKATVAETKADAAVATGARNVDRIIGVASPLPTNPVKPPAPPATPTPPKQP